MVKTIRTKDITTERSDDLPDGFHYPVGYFESGSRVRDPLQLAEFSELVWPFVIQYEPGKVVVDGSAPVCVRRLNRAPDGKLQALIRYLDLGGEPDASMQATYVAEDAVSHARDLSQSGHDSKAIQLLRSLPRPFQQTALALECLVESQKALGFYGQALADVQALIKASDVPTQWALTLHRITEAELLVLLGRVCEAEEALDARRDEFASKYQYFGVRAAIALFRGDSLLAKQLIVRAGGVEDYHAYKLMWDPALAELKGFIRSELLTEDMKPLQNERNSQTQRLLHRIQGALLRGNRNLARNLAEGVIAGRISDWSCAGEAYLCWIGLGDFERAKRWSQVLPFYPHGFQGLIQASIGLIDRDSNSGSSNFENACQEARVPTATADALEAIIAIAFGGAASNREYLLENRIAELSQKDSSGEWINLWSLNQSGNGQIFLLKTRDLPGSLSDEGMPTQDRKVFAVSTDALGWFETQLAANTAERTSVYRGYRTRLELSGWGILRAFSENQVAGYPLVAANWKIAAEDPNFYFSNGKNCLGLQVPFENRLYHALYLATHSDVLENGS